MKVVIFDLDNTIIDFLKFKKMSIDNAISAMVDVGLRKSDAKKVKKEIDKIYSKKGMEYQYVFNEALKKVLGKVDYKILASAVVAYRKVKTAYMNPYPNAIRIFKELIRRNYKLGIFSDAPLFQMWQRLAEIGLTNMFDFAFSTQEIGKDKRKKEAFVWLMNKLNLDPKDVTFVGDSVDRDIYWPKKLGMKTILAVYGKNAWGKPKRNIKPDYKIKNILELLKILR